MHLVHAVFIVVAGVLSIMSTNEIHHDVVLTCITRKLRDVDHRMIDNADYIHAKILLG